jgi:hypothetical protein
LGHRLSWTWFVTLKYPEEKSPKHRGSRASSAQDAFYSWTSSLMMRDGTPELDSYFCAIEHRDNGDTLFHVLLFNDSHDQMLKNWRWFWFEISGGGSWERPLDSKIVGLFRYFFFKKHCDLQYSIAGDSAYLRAEDYQHK